MKGKGFVKLCLVGLMALAFVALGQPAMAQPDKIIVAYFPGWPGTFEYGWANNSFEKEMGVKLEFREFGSGAEMTTAMASGDVSIAYALGATPFVIATTQGMPIKMVGISENYSESENLVAQGDAGIVKPRDLIGKKIGVPFGTTAHYRLLGILETFGIKENEVSLLDLANPDILPAFIRKDIDAGCGWEPAVSKMLENGGRILVSSEDQIRWGYNTYGVIAISEEFGKKYPDLVTKFLKVVNDSTKLYHQNPDATYAQIGKMAGITPEKTKEIMSTMGFYSKQDQLSPTWLGTKGSPGRVAANLKEVAAFLVKQGELDKALDDYGPSLDTSFYEKVD